MLMNNEYQCNHGRGHCKHGHRGGSSSFWRHDPEVVFKVLALKEGDCFLDIGCGPGEYAIQAAKLVGSSGTVYALDKSESLITELNQRAGSEGITNITAMVADATKSLPIRKSCVEVCLVATVLHIPDVAKRARTLFAEIRRVLKSDGRLSIIECHKKETPFGPPKHIRISPEDLEYLITRYGFEKVGMVDLGYNYMIQFAISLNARTEKNKQKGPD
jgi:ubiquinone/menaquinone biosynthesis C-methylase UbiE